MNVKNRITSLILAISVLAPVFTATGFAEEAAADGTVQTEQRVLLTDGFEGGIGRTSSIITGYGMPAGWTFEDSRNPVTYVVNAGITAAEKASGASSLAIDAVDRNSAGFISQKLNITNETPAFDISVKVKNSAEYANNHPVYVLYFYMDDILVKTVSGETGQVLSTSSDEWVENLCHVDYTYYPEHTVLFNNVRIKLANAYIGKDGAAGEGSVYFDDLSVIESYDSAYTVLDVLADETTGWYNIGDTVVYKPQKELPEAIYDITATVHNSYGEVVYESTLSSDEFEKNGWIYTPKEVGHYTVGFKGKTDRGEIALVSAYRTGGKKQGTFVIPERSFVVAKETKPMEERNQKLTFASEYTAGGTQADYDDWSLIYKMLDSVGFSGVRMHPFPWTHEPNNHVKPNPGKGLYNWTEIDRLFEGISKYGLQVWATILYTPEWASTHAGQGNSTSKDASTLLEYMVNMPTRLEYYTEYLTQVANRYGTEIDMWEIWNETNERITFFKGTAADYVYVLSNAYKLLKEIQPDDDVIMGGMIARDSRYYGRVLDAGIYDYTDAMVIHNKFPDYMSYQAEETKRGYKNKPWINGEAHYILVRQDAAKLDYTEREQAFELLAGYFFDIKGGVDKVALFQVDTSFDLEALPFKKSIGERALSYGLWRRRPFIEPRLLALVCHTWFDQMGQDFSFVSEHSFEGETKAMRFSSDGEPVVAIWNLEADAELPAEIKKCITKTSEIIDWEGKPAAFSDKLRQGTVYFIKGLDTEGLDNIPEAEISVLSTKREKREQISETVGYASKSQLFDEKTFMITGDVNWIDTDWTWRAKATGEKQDDSKAKFAVSVNEKGMYLMIEVDDDTPYFNNSNTAQLYNTDSVQIGIDVTGEGYTDMRTEIDVGLSNDGLAIYKRAVADVFGAIPPGWTPEGGMIDSSNANVTANNGKINYKIFIPASELFPFEFDPDDKDWRMSLVINDNNGTVRRGCLVWSDGIDGGKDVGKYGKIVLP